MRYYDAHVHLQDPSLAPHGPAVCEHLVRIGLAEAVCNGTSAGDWDVVAALARQHPWIRPAYGLHPWQVGNAVDGWLDQLSALLQATPAATIGEIGLDRWILDSARSDDPRLTGLARAPLETQEAALVAQLELAARLDRVPTLHCLQAWDRLESILARPISLPPAGFLLHAFAGPPEKVPSFLGRGAFFSFNGNFLAPRHVRTRDIFARLLPLDRILVETDAPSMPLPESRRKYVLPAPAGGGPAPNHPANLEVTYAALADLRGLSVATLAEAVEGNFHRLFKR